MTSMNTRFGTKSEVTPEELAQAKVDIALVFDLMTARSIAELDAAVTKGVTDGAFFGKTVARIVEEKRAELGKPSRLA